VTLGPLSEENHLSRPPPRGHFPSDDAASKLIWLALRNITADWSRAAKEWKLAMNQFAILYEERFTQSAHGAGR
jgi:putative transposase